MIFQDEIFYQSPTIFQDEYSIGSISNFVPITYLSLLICIHPSLLQYHLQSVYDLRFHMECHKLTYDRLYRIIVTAPIVHDLVIITITSKCNKQVIGLWGIKTS